MDGASWPSRGEKAANITAKFCFENVEINVQCRQVCVSGPSPGPELLRSASSQLPNNRRDSSVSGLSFSMLIFGFWHKFLDLRRCLVQMFKRQMTRSFQMTAFSFHFIIEFSSPIHLKHGHIKGKTTIDYLSAGWLGRSVRQLRSLKSMCLPWLISLIIHLTC